MSQTKKEELLRTTAAQLLSDLPHPELIDDNTVRIRAVTKDVDSPIVMVVATGEAAVHVIKCMQILAESLSEAGVSDTYHLNQTKFMEGHDDQSNRN